MIEKKRVIALGFFDGVHIGHSALLERALEVAAGTGLVPSVITFDTHPLSLITGKNTPLINSAEDRAGLIHRIFGIDDVIFLHFDAETARMPWADFVTHLVTEFGARHLVAGHDYSFGDKGEGNVERLRGKCAALGVGCDVIPPVKYKGVTSSSTYIRELIAAGDMRQASEFLGHPHVLTDFVQYGFRLGRTLGTPTINMRFSDGVLIPAHGVYATRVYLDDGGERVGVTNVGVRPTVADSASVTAETHILHFQGNLYGRAVRLEFYERMRPEMKFSGVDVLKERILRDCRDVEAYFGEPL
ncbi:MAG: riboflavin biosynthesis protein RibF [Oscillospiraceae bacterium]|nr:riboflavin biosynthesis protein RibF [Oscillospiraceae bacterium]